VNVGRVLTDDLGRHDEGGKLDSVEPDGGADSQGRYAEFGDLWGGELPVSRCVQMEQSVLRRVRTK
jgi:hypothetical protein